MDNQPPSPASAPVTPTGTTYVPPTPPPANPSPVTPPPSPAKPRSWMILIVVLVLLLLLAGGGYMYYMNMQKPKPVVQEKVMETPSPTMVPTNIPMTSPTTSASLSADLKVYTNEKNGYAITYSTNKLVRFQCPDEELDLQEKLPSNEHLEGTPMPTCGRDSRFLIEGKTYTDEYTLPDYSSNYSVKTEQFMLNGIPATKYTYTQTKPFEGQGGPAWFQEVLVKRDNKTYEFYLGSQKFQSVFDEVLETLKFTN